MSSRLVKIELLLLIIFTFLTPVFCQENTNWNVNMDEKYEWNFNSKWDNMEAEGKISANIIEIESDFLFVNLSTHFTGDEGAFPLSFMINGSVSSEDNILGLFLSEKYMDMLIDNEIAILEKKMLIIEYSEDHKIKYDENGILLEEIYYDAYNNIEIIIKRTKSTIWYWLIPLIVIISSISIYFIIKRIKSNKWQYFPN